MNDMIRQKFQEWLQQPQTETEPDPAFFSIHSCDNELIIRIQSQLQSLQAISIIDSWKESLLAEAQSKKDESIRTIRFITGCHKSLYSLLLPNWVNVRNNTQVYGQAYGQAYGQVYGQVYGQAYGQAYEQAYGQVYGQAYGQVYGQAYGLNFVFGRMECQVNFDCQNEPSVIVLIDTSWYFSDLRNAVGNDTIAEFADMDGIKTFALYDKISNHFYNERKMLLFKAVIN